MKKYLIYSLFVSLLLVATFVTSVSATATTTATSTVATSTMTNTQLVELLISIGVIAPDKAAAARAAVAGSTTVATSTATVSAISTSTSYIQVLSPNGGESWGIDMDVPYTITWGSTGLPFVRVALISSASKNPTCELSAIPVASVNGNNSFKTLLKTAKCYNLITGTSTPLKDGTYKVRVYSTDAKGVTVKDESNATFKITPIPVPSIKVTYPNGGEKLTTGSYYDIKYTLANTSENALKLSFLDSLGNTRYSINVFGSKGVYHLKIPTSLNDAAYKLKIEMTATNNAKLEDISDNFFWISSAN